MSLSEDRLAALEARIARIEYTLNIEKPAKAETLSDLTILDKPVAPPSEPTKPGNWLGMIAVICFVLAATFIVKLSVDSGWLTPVRQVSLAAIFGVSLIVAGLLLLKTDRGYASYLPGAGVIVLYLTISAAYIINHLIVFHTAIILDCILSGVCIYLFVRIKHDIYILTAAVGAYAAPFVLAFDSFSSMATEELRQGTIFTIYYFLFCSFVFILIAIWARSRTLTMISAYLAMLANAVMGLCVANILDVNMLIAVTLIVQFFIFSMGTFLYAYLNHSVLTSLEAWSYFPVLLLFYAVEYYFINKILPGLAPWFSLGFAVFFVTLHQIANKILENLSFNSLPVVLDFATLVFVHSVYIELLPDTVRPWLFVIFMLGSALISDRYLPSSEETISAYQIPFLAALGIICIEYAEILIQLLGSAQAIDWLLSFSAFVSIWAVFVIKRARFVQYDQVGYGLLTAAHVLGVVTLYQLASSIGSLAVSIAWLVYAVSVMVFAIIRRDKLMARSSLIILAFAAGKALLYDVASAPTLVRILCLLVTGIVLYGAGLFIRKIAEWK